MKNLNKLASECEAELRSIGIEVGKVSKWTVDTRAKSRWGLCRYDTNGAFEIKISAMLLQDDVDDIAAKDTIIHELLHTVKGCVGHKGKWKEYADKVNSHFPQYHIKRTTAYEEKGLEQIDRKRTNRYCVKCTACGQEYFRETRSSIITNPGRYRCGVCKGNLVRIK